MDPYATESSSQESESLPMLRFEGTTLEASCAASCDKAHHSLEQACLTQKGRWKRRTPGAWKFVLGFDARETERGVEIELAAHDIAVVFRAADLTEAAVRLLGRANVLKVAFDAHDKKTLVETAFPVTVASTFNLGTDIHGLVSRTLGSSLPRRGPVAYAAFRVFAANDGNKCLVELDGNKPSEPPVKKRLVELDAPRVSCEPPAQTLAVHRKFFDEAMTVADIAKTTRIKESTVIAHLIAAVNAGLHYDWSRIHSLIGRDDADAIARTVEQRGVNHNSIKRHLKHLETWQIRLYCAHATRLRSSPPSVTPDDVEDPPKNDISAVQVFFI